LMGLIFVWTDWKDLQSGSRKLLKDMTHQLF
jgi:hypothetical protein